MGSLVVLDLMGGVALLLWGLHMVLSGVLRAFGPDLRRFLGKALGNRFSAFAAGLGLTALLQSLNISAVAPVLFVIGLVSFRRGGQTRIRDLGRVAIGLGLTLLALHILLDTLAPAEDAPTVRALLASITNDPVLCVLIAAALTWAAHSSVAVVLLIMALALSHFVTPEAALALVLGANLGSAINPLLESGNRGDPASRRLPVGNMINRLVGILLALPFLQPIARELAAWQPDAAKMTAEFHMLFNIALAAIFIGPLDALAALLVRILPEKKQPADAAAPRYLDEAALENPPLALANAARETLRMGDTVEAMLREVMAALINNDRKLTADISRMDDIVDRLDDAIKLYVTKLTRDSLDEREGRRAMEIVSFTINLEHIGDIIDKNCGELAAKKIKRRYQFSPEGAAELSAFHKRIVESLQSAFGIFMTGDVEAARKMLREKADLRKAELDAAEQHFERLREGRPESIETTSLHLDVLSDLKRIHSHICSVAYPVLEAAGELPAFQRTGGAPATDALAYQPKLP